MSSEFFIGMLYGGLGCIPAWGIGKNFPNIEAEISYSNGAKFGLGLLTIAGLAAGNSLYLMFNGGKQDVIPVTDTSFQSGVLLGSALGAIAIRTIQRLRTKKFRE